MVSRDCLEGASQIDSCIMYEELFKDCPNDEDTIILQTEYKDVCEIPVMTQHWKWDGIKGISAIAPVGTPANENAKLDKLLMSLNIRSDYTVKQSNGFVFITYDCYAVD